VRKVSYKKERSYYLKGRADHQRPTTEGRVRKRTTTGLARAEGTGIVTRGKKKLTSQAPRELGFCGGKKVGPHVARENPLKEKGEEREGPGKRRGARDETVRLCEGTVNDNR